MMLVALLLTRMFPIGNILLLHTQITHVSSAVLEATEWQLSYLYSRQVHQQPAIKIIIIACVSLL